MGKRISAIAIVAMGAALALMVGVPGAMARPAPRPMKYKGSDAGSYVTVNFSFDGAAEATVTTYAGRDNLGGPFTGQSVAEYVDAKTTCSLPSGGTGEKYTLVGGMSATTYSGTLNQVYAYWTSAVLCVDLSTGAEAGSFTQEIIGGSGKLANVSGTATGTFQGQGLAAPSSPGNGLFGAVQTQLSGSIIR